MFFTTALGSFICIFWIILAMLFVFIKKPSEIKCKGEIATYFLFHLSLCSSIWGLAAPRIGSAFTTFRLSIFLFLFFFLFTFSKRKPEAIYPLNKTGIILIITYIFMIINGLITLLFSVDQAYTFSRLFNLGMDLLFSLCIIFYLKYTKCVTVTILNLFVTFLGQLFVGILESFTNPIYTDTHLDKLGANFLGLYNFHIPSSTFYNTNDYAATLFILGIVIISYLLISNKYKTKTKISIFLINFILLCLSLISYLSGAIILQLGLSLPIFFFSVTGIYSFIKLKKKFFLSFILSLVFFILSIVSPDIFSLKNPEPETSYTSTFKESNSFLSNNLSFISLTNESTQIRVSASDQENFSSIGNEATDRSIYYRITLLKSAINTFLNHPLGVGLGNTQKIAEYTIADQVRGISKIHCYPIECIADFGIPFVILIICFLWNFLKQILTQYQSTKKTIFSNGIGYIFLILSTICIIFATTAPSCAQDLKSLWIYLSFLIILVNYPTSNLIPTEKNKS